MAAEHKQKLEQQLWNIANTLRESEERRVGKECIIFWALFFINTSVLKWVCMPTPFYNPTV